MLKGLGGSTDGCTSSKRIFFILADRLHYYSSMNNPGTWLMHCHIAYYASFGLAMQIMERQKAAAEIWLSLRTVMRCRWRSTGVIIGIPVVERVVYTGISGSALIRDMRVLKDGSEIEVRRKWNGIEMEVKSK